MKGNPYSRENPVRKIDNITHIKEPTGYLCGQSCVAMLAGVSVDEAIKIIGTDRGTNKQNLKKALDYYGIYYAPKSTKYDPNIPLPNIKYGHWGIYHDGVYYDPEFGVLHECPLDAIERTHRSSKPVILTETGAINDSHTGPFRFYGCDHDGLIFHDVTYPALFAGAAGSGHIWHWDSCVEPKNLWRHFTPMVRLLDGIQMDAENFNGGVINHGDAWILTLTGNTHILILVRNKTDRWDYVLRDGIEPNPVENLYIMLGKKPDCAKVFWLMDENPGELAIIENGVKLPVFIHGCVIRVKNKI